MARRKRAEVIRDVYGRAIERAESTGSGQIRTVNVGTVAKEIPFANLVGSPDDAVFSSLALDIGFHEGEMPEGSLGIMNMTPPESVIIAADLAVKSGSVDVGFMDRFKGALIITGKRSDVEHAMRENLEFFSKSLHYKVCELSVQ